MSKRENHAFHDDGRTIANMDLEGTSWARHKKTPFPNSEQRKQFSELNLTSKERRAMILGALSAIFPIIAAFGVLYFLAFLFMDFVWLR